MNPIEGAESSSEATPIGLAMAEALGSFADNTRPVETKRRLVKRIQNVVNDPKMGPYIAGRAADLVVFCDVPLAQLDRILQDIEAMRATGNLRSAGSLFHSKARELAARYGRQWDAVTKKP